jgi:hypothetical protein
MTGSVRDLIPFAAAFIGGWGALASALAWTSVADVLNRDRGPGDQIPTIMGSWNDLRRHWEFTGSHGFFYRRKLLKEFRRQHPDNPLYFWCLGGQVWSFCFIAIAAAAVFLNR